MLKWLTSLFKAPQPAGPPQTLRGFTTADPTISRTTVEGEAWRIETAEPQTFRLFEVANPGVEQCMISYRARMKCEQLSGRAYLEMWCRLPGKGEFFSKGLQQTLSGTGDWASFEILFYLKRGQQPDLIKLNLTVEGRGSIWFKELELLSTPLSS